MRASHPNAYCFLPGTTTVTYTATDAKGNVSTCSFAVTVTKIRASGGGSNRQQVQQGTQILPLIIKQLAPNPTEGDLIVQLESLVEQDVQFEFFNATGKLVQSEKRRVEKGENRVSFSVWDLPQGIYFIQTDIGKGRKAPTKFVKL
jgi:hypothetical protein